MQRHYQRMSPPVFPGDAEKTRMSRLLNVMLWGTLLMELIRSFMFLFTPGVQILFSLLGTVSNVLILLFIRWLLQRGYVRVASIFFVALIWLVLTVAIIFFGGSTSAIFFVYIELIVAAALLLGGRGVFTVTTMSIASGFGLYLLEQNGIITPISTLDNIALFLATTSHAFIVTASLLYLNHRNYSSALQTAWRNERALAVSNAELNGLRASLEEQVTERTQRAETANMALAEQIWLVTGQSKLNDALRGEQHVDTLAGNALRAICLYVEAPVGAMYERHADVLELVGGYAYAPSTPLSFQLGEGLVGQVARQKRPLSLYPIADALLPLTSGLGERQPDFVMALPVLYENQLLGVLEIGHWQSLTERQVAFLETVLESIGIAWNSAQTRARMNAFVQNQPGGREYIGQ